MADLVNTIVFSADGTQAVTETKRVGKSLDDLASAAAAAGARAGAALSPVSGATAEVASDVEKKTSRIIAQFKRLELDARTAGKSLSESFQIRAEAAGLSLRDSPALQAQLQSLQALDAAKAASAANSLKAIQAQSTANGLLRDTQNAANKALADSPSILGNVGVSARQTANALRLLPAQLTDIVIQLRSGQNPFTILLQQGGQIKDQFGGIGAAASALGRFFVTLLTPVNLLAVGVAGLTTAYVLGARESENFRKALILTGSNAGVTAEQLAGLAKRVADITGSTQGNAAKVLTDLVASGNFGGDQLERIAAAAINLQRSTGAAIAETIKQFSDLGREPVNASIRLNESTRFLTRSLFDQIFALEQQGRVQDAARLAQEAAAQSAERRLPALQQNLGYVERAWRAVTDAAKGAWDAILNVGRPSDPVEAIGKLESTIQARIDAIKPGGPLMPYQLSNKAALEQELKALQAQKAALEGVAAGRAATAQATREQNLSDQAHIKWVQEGLRYLSDEQRLRNALNQATELGRQANESPKAIQERLAAIRAAMSRQTPKMREDPAPALLEMDIDAIKKDAEKVLQVYGNTAKLIEAYRSNGLIDDKAYFASKRDLQNYELQTTEEALTAQIARYQKEASSSKDRLKLLEKIKDAEAALYRARADGATSLQILSITEQANTRKLAKSFEDARQAAQAYLDTLNKSAAFELAGMGAGTEERNRQAGRLQIEDRYSQQRQDLLRSKRDAEFNLGRPLSDEAQKYYDDQLKLLNEYLGKALDAYDQNYLARLRKEGDFVVGATEAMRNYVTESNKTAKQTEAIFTNAFKNMEDALVTFVTTGKLSFANLANSIVADITRIIIRQQISNAIGLSGNNGNANAGAGNPLMDILSGAVGAITGGVRAAKTMNGVSNVLTDILGGLIGKRADGGPVAARGLYQVNERGPELLTVAGKDYLMMGATSGHVTANDNLIKTSPTTIKTVNITINQSFAANTNRATTLQAAADARRQLEFSGRNL